MACVFYINLLSVTHYGYEIDKSPGSKFKSKVGDDAAIPHSSGLHHTALTQMPWKKHMWSIQGDMQVQDRPAATVLSNLMWGMWPGRKNGKWYHFLFGLESQIFYSV